MFEVGGSPNDAPTSGAYVVIVRRGAMEVFRTLRENFRERVVWDRRTKERRTEGQPDVRERRAAERRRPSPGTWVVHGFLLAFLTSSVERLEPTDADTERVA